MMEREKKTKLVYGTSKEEETENEEEEEEVDEDDDDFFIIRKETKEEKKVKKLDANKILFSKLEYSDCSLEEVSQTNFDGDKNDQIGKQEFHDVTQETKYYRTEHYGKNYFQPCFLDVFCKNYISN